MWSLHLFAHRKVSRCQERGRQQPLIGTFVEGGNQRLPASNPSHNPRLNRPTKQQYFPFLGTSPSSLTAVKSLDLEQVWWFLSYGICGVFLLHLKQFYVQKIILSLFFSRNVLWVAEGRKVLSWEVASWAMECCSMLALHFGMLSLVEQTISQMPIV